MIRNGKRVPAPEHRQHILDNSSCEVSLYDNENLEIIFTGQAAHIPALKNSKIPGTNFITPDTQNRMKAMRLLFLAAIQRKGVVLPTRSEKQIMVTIFYNCRTDDDNAIATLKDWMQPWSKNHTWNVGLITNDKLISGIPIRADWHNDKYKIKKENKTKIQLIPYRNITTIKIEWEKSPQLKELTV